MMEINPITCSQSSSNNKSAISRGTSWRFLMLGALSLWLVVVCIVGAVEYQNRLQYERHATTSAENISQLLEQNISDIILKSDLAIYSVIHEAERQLASGHIDEHSMNDYINWQFSLSPDLDSIRIANADGDISYGIGVLSGIAAEVNIGHILHKALTVHGIYVGSREMFVAMNAAMAEHKIEPIIDRLYSFEEAPDAFRHLELGKHFGKIVIRI